LIGKLLLESIKIRRINLEKPLNSKRIFEMLEKLLIYIFSKSKIALK
jgi:hypothetical protein